MLSAVANPMEYLEELTIGNDCDSIKLCLESAPKEQKGGLFEEYLALLYRGNGWPAKVTGGRSDAGADLLLYNPDASGKVAFVVQAKNQNKPLSVDDTRIELLQFEEQAL